jgi:hypothetical protein
MIRSSRVYHTTLARAFVALLAGIVLGGLSTAAFYVHIRQGLDFTWQTLAWVLESLRYNNPILSALIIGVGMLAWAGLHATGRRGWPDFLLAGALVRPAEVMLVSRLVYDEQGPWTDYLPFILFFACQGAVVGLIVWRMAYRAVPGAATD